MGVGGAQAVAIRLRCQGLRSHRETVRSWPSGRQDHRSGNIFVATAKRMVSGIIDAVTWSTEIAIAHRRGVNRASTADLIGQAEQACRLDSTITDAKDIAAKCRRISNCVCRARTPGDAEHRCAVVESTSSSPTASNSHRPNAPLAEHLNPDRRSGCVIAKDHSAGAIFRDPVFPGAAGDSCPAQPCAADFPAPHFASGLGVRSSRSRSKSSEPRRTGPEDPLAARVNNAVSERICRRTVNACSSVSLTIRTTRRPSRNRKNGRACDERNLQQCDSGISAAAQQPDRCEEPYGAPQLDVPVCLNVQREPYAPEPAVVSIVSEAR